MKALTWKHTYTDTKPDGIFRQPHRMAPDQTTTLTEKLSYIFIKNFHQWNWIFPTVYHFSDGLSEFSDMFRQLSTYSSKLFIHEIEFFRRFIIFQQFCRIFPTVYQIFPTFSDYLLNFFWYFWCCLYYYYFISYIRN